MNFERNQDPLKSMGVGRRNKAIPLVSVKYYRDGNEITLTDSEYIKEFAERFSKLDIPNDRLFGIQRVIFTREEKYMDDSGSLPAKMATALGASQSTPAPIERTREVNMSIDEYAGKDFIFEDELYPMPTLEKIKEEGFDHLHKNETEANDKFAKEMESQKAQAIALADTMKSMTKYSHEALITTEALRAKFLEVDNNIKTEKVKIKKKEKRIFLVLI